MTTPTKPKYFGICPVCGATYNAPPALSRADGTSLICPDCGIREALSTIGVPYEKQEEIIDIIHSHVKEARGSDDE